jgi:cell wall-associated NlpC family hydrolase
MKLAVIRFASLAPVQKDLLDATMAKLLLSSYERTVSLKAAPVKTDCVTAIHYLVQKVFQIDLPRGWIGDMPRQLCQANWSLQIIDSAELQTGDLIFLKQQNHPTLISHLAIALASDQIFHCTRLLGPVIQTAHQVFERYEQQLMHDQILYIDSRNLALREQQGGMYIKQVLTESKHKENQYETYPFSYDSSRGLIASILQ